MWVTLKEKVISSPCSFFFPRAPPPQNRGIVRDSVSTFERTPLRGRLVAAVGSPTFSTHYATFPFKLFGNNTPVAPIYYERGRCVGRLLFLSSAGNAGEFLKDRGEVYDILVSWSQLENSRSKTREGVPRASKTYLLQRSSQK